MKENIDDFI